MEYRKAGECLSYGLGHELIRNEDPSDKHNPNLKAFVTDFALRGYLSKDTVARVGKVLDRDADNLSQKKNQFMQLSKLIVRDLKKKYEFNDFEQLVDVLNNIEIPSWVFKTKDILMELFPQVYLVHELLYYMIEDEDRYYFRCIHIRSVGDLLEFSQDFFEDFDTDTVPYPETNHTISTRYSEILGFNEETMTFYMKYRHTNKMYVEYHADTKQEIIHRYRCFGVVNNKFPVIEIDNTISVVIGSEIKKIKEKDIHEDYEVKDSFIYVYPTYRIPTMFRPYILMLDGSRMEIPQNDAIAYVMEKVNDDICDFGSPFLDDDEDKLKTGEYKENVVFSLDYFDRFLTGRYDLEDYREARTYHFIVKLLAAYLPSDKDVLDYFFVLSDVSKRLTKDRSLRFIRNGVYWKLNELHLTGKLSSIINDKDKLKRKLLQDAYWEDDSIDNDTYESDCAKYVGYFSIVKGRIVAHKEEIRNAMCIGDMLFAKWLDRPGVVSYNLESGAYEIQYNRELTKEEVQLVLNAYHIVYAAYCVSVDKCRLD